MAFKLRKQDVAQLNKLATNFDGARTALIDWLDDLANEWESEFSNKSNKWQESDTGQQTKEQIDMIRKWINATINNKPTIDPDALA